MQTINIVCSAETIVKRSKFISYLLPISNFKNFYQELHIQHPKASHIIYAFRRMNEYGQIVENSSDGGEPKGCAAIPTLKVLRGHNLIECALITVRYFGGIKLGTGGMVRAYTQAANTLIKNAPLKPWLKKEHYSISCNYADLSRVKYMIDKLDIEITRQSFTGYDVNLELLSDPKSYEEFLKRVKGVIKIE